MPVDEDDFVRFLYEVLFDRTAVEPEHVGHWAAQLRSGEVDLVGMCRTFLETPEARERVPRSPLFAPVVRDRVLDVFASEPELVAAAGTPTLVDIGALALDSEDDAWRPLARGGWRVVGFEPQEEERAKRMAVDPGMVLLPHIVGDGRQGTFHLNADPATSSLYPPAVDELRRLQGVNAGAVVVATEPVLTTRLDDVAETAGAVFLKLDVQGAELSVLHGAERRLDDVLVIQAEVEFTRLYEGQPRFADVDAFLFERGFELFDIPVQMRRYHDDGLRPHEWPARRLLWGDAVWVAGADRLEASPADQAAAAAWVVHDLYRGYDWSYQLLQDVQRDHGTPVAAAYQRIIDRGLR